MSARNVGIGLLLAVLSVLAAGSLAYGVRTALRDSADLERRAEEAALFRARSDPYADPDMTYPPTAPPVFAALVPLGPSSTRRIVWIALNVAAMGLLGGVVVATWGRDWPVWARAAFVLTVVASKPARAGMALGQFHLIPTALIVAAEAASHRATLSGLLVGLALIKPTMSAPYLFVMLARRRWRALAVALGLQLALFAITSGWLGVGPVRLTREWLANARGQMKAGTLDVPSLLSRAGLLADEASGVASLVLLGAAGATIVAFRDRSSLGLVAFATFGAALLTYHRHYDLVLFLPALAYLIDAGMRGRRRWPRIAALAFGAWMIVPSDVAWVGRIGLLLEAAFLPTSYLILGVVLWLLMVEPVDSSSRPASS